METSAFADQTIVVTGAASGFGKILAERLAARGARLVIADLDLEGLEHVAAPLRVKETQVVNCRCDVTVEADVAELVEASVNSYGRLDIAVNNAGISGAMKPLIDIEEGELNLNFAANAKGVFFGMKHQIRQMLTQDGGVILNVASMAGLGAAPKLAAYSAAKHAVVGLTKTAAVEYARANICINAVCPFFSPTPIVTDAEVPDLQGFLAQGYPMKRLGRPDEIVGIMLMMVNPNNSCLSGQTISVDGGTSAL